MTLFRSLSALLPHQKGAHAEALAADFLRQQGLSIMAQNWRCRFGEIDIIAQDGATILFVEVRSRQSKNYGGAAWSITPSKQKKLLATAQCYLATLPRMPHCRMDAILIEGNNPPQWLKNVIEYGD